VIQGEFKPFLLFALALLGVCARAHPPSSVVEICKKDLRDLSVSEGLVFLSVQGHPQLKLYLNRLVNDPLMPVSVARVVHEAITNRTTSIRELTDELRAAYKIPARVRGQYRFEVDEFVDNRKGAVSQGSYLYFSATGSLDEVGVRPPSVILLEDAGRFPSPEESLVHELAHIRWIAFLDRNFQAIAAKGTFPSWAFHYSGGQFFLRSDFYDYLSERYAYEIQSQYAKSLILSGRSRPDVDPVFGDLRQFDETAVRQKIIEHIRRVYANANKPEFRQFDGMSLSSILLGKVPNDEIQILMAP